MKTARRLQFGTVHDGCTVYLVLSSPNVHARAISYSTTYMMFRWSEMLAASVTDDLQVYRYRKTSTLFPDFLLSVSLWSEF